MQYVGETSRTLKLRFGEHCSRIKKPKQFDTLLYQHFKRTGHSIRNVTVQPVEKVTFDKDATKTVKKAKLHDTELKWIKLLQTPFPLGLNDNIYHKGNISKMPDFDVYELFGKRKRKYRSHGVRKNGNVRRKSLRLKKMNTSLNVLADILNTRGRHDMMSYLSSLPVPVKLKLDEEANKFYDKGHRFYFAALLTRCYLQHALRPTIDSEIDHKRYFIKVPFINKGIEFIDLPSIFRDGSVISSLPTYFNNKEHPIICYKYNKPIRNLIFNFNKLVSDLDINENAPNS